MFLRGINYDIGTYFREGKLSRSEFDEAIIKKVDYERDESVQANYIVELLNIFKKENVFAAFVFTFINPRFKYNDNPKLDLDLASYGIVKSVDETSESNYKGLSWIPKEAFYMLSKYYEE